ncbi:hypothetical protein [Erinnyis ello granulovirus]|uniref:Uncharacterized protein n=1 Tax=Erinnyis ello granulovirus TaxID=307444 RepID=A0A097DAJ1_9BBAC|nr:hypothetical protein [Erinnyis ello granulovirus]AIS92015.1 hypothetical protein [Erinnyis ello granulovirus]ARX71354.1 hypothetical protein EREL_015 [Erinnyis ello granulovirus]ARX71484.1 hypothetical protein EREL_015 [Erinnyis ello granulovirus]ARX71614.1 hypothetical protein EREL_015 [Erinnyis ello granulovirus]ARX71744.1 hypothetical protein EREL_015 [Erinnyis ello granulovirus]
MYASISGYLVSRSKYKCMNANGRFSSPVPFMMLRHSTLTQSNVHYFKLNIRKKRGLYVQRMKPNLLSEFLVFNF